MTTSIKLKKRSFCYVAALCCAASSIAMQVFHFDFGDIDMYFKLAAPFLLVLFMFFLSQKSAAAIAFVMLIPIAGDIMILSRMLRDYEWFNRDRLSLPITRIFVYVVLIVLFLLACYKKSMDNRFVAAAFFSVAAFTLLLYFSDLIVSNTLFLETLFISGLGFVALGLDKTCAPNPQGHLTIYNSPVLHFLTIFCVGVFCVLGLMYTFMWKLNLFYIVLLPLSTVCFVIAVIKKNLWFLCAPILTRVMIYSSEFLSDRRIIFTIYMIAILLNVALLGAFCLAMSQSVKMKTYFQVLCIILLGLQLVMCLLSISEFVAFLYFAHLMALYLSLFLLSISFQPIIEQPIDVHETATIPE